MSKPYFEEQHYIGAPKKAATKPKPAPLPC